MIDDLNPIEETNVSDYILNCTMEGVNSRVGICDRLKRRIGIIDKKLHEADTLRIERLKLYKMLQELGDESLKRRRTVIDTPEIDLDDNSDEAKIVQRKICSAIEQFGALNNRDIIQKVGDYQQEREYFRAIKFLVEQEILERQNSSERKLAPGSKWEQRSNI